MKMHSEHTITLELTTTKTMTFSLNDEGRVEINQAGYISVISSSLQSVSKHDRALICI